MLNWIVSRIKSADSDHPLGSEKGIGAYLAQVPVVNPQSALQDIGHWFAEPERLAADLSPENMARAVERLDEFAQDAIRRCWSGYFTENFQDYLSDLALRPLETYYRHTFLAIRHTLALLTAPGRKEADRDQLTRLAIRAMHALVQGKKISHFAYRGPDAEWWRTCHELLFFARNLNILHTKQAIYPEDEQQTSVWREYLVGVLFEVAPLSNLSPPSMEALDCIVRWMEARRASSSAGRSAGVPQEGLLSAFRFLRADFDLAVRQTRHADGQALLGFLTVADVRQQASFVRDDALIADLTAGFAVEGCFRGQDVNFFSLMGFLFAAARAINRQHCRMTIQAVVAGETDLAVQLDFRFHAGDFARFAAARSLLLH